MDKIEKMIVVVLFTFFSALLINKILIMLRESNAKLLSEVLQSSLFVSLRGYNEFYIIGIPILYGFMSALIAVQLSKEKEVNKYEIK